MSKTKLIKKLISAIEAADNFPKPTVSKVMIGPDERARSQYPRR